MSKDWLGNLPKSIQHLYSSAKRLYVTSSDQNNVKKRQRENERRRKSRWNNQSQRKSANWTINKAYSLMSIHESCLPIHCYQHWNAYVFVHWIVHQSLVLKCWHWLLWLFVAIFAVFDCHLMDSLRTERTFLSSSVRVSIRFTCESIKKYKWTFSILLTLQSMQSVCWFKFIVPWQWHNLFSSKSAKSKNITIKCKKEFELCLVDRLRYQTIAKQQKKNESFSFLRSFARPWVYYSFCSEIKLLHTNFHVCWILI